MIPPLAAWTRTEVELTLEQARAVAASGVAEVLPAAGGKWTVQTGSKVGVVVGDGWELRVRPKIAIPRLVFLLGYARDQRGWCLQQAAFEQEDELYPAIANGFSWQLTRALERGVLHGYVPIDERRHDVRGRIRFGDQVGRAALPLPVEVAYDDFSADVLENRILLTAASLLLRLRRVPLEARRRLLRARAALDGVTPLPAWRDAKAPPTNRLNAHYAPALTLAELVLAGASIGSELGETAATAFLFDMNVVFEEFVSTAFREAMAAHGGQVREQAKGQTLDGDGRLALQPDLTWWVGGRCRAILDAKYKAIDEGRARHPDAYQMLAYCTAYGLPRGYLVYAKDSGTAPVTHAVRNSGIEIVVTTIDVEREPNDVLAQVSKLAARVLREALAVVAPQQ